MANSFQSIQCIDGEMFARKWLHIVGWTDIPENDLDAGLAVVVWHGETKTFHLVNWSSAPEDMKKEAYQESNRLTYGNLKLSK